ncbi:MAG: hypothetical protein WDO56_05490 [Gammaproteobacteria bacterium]
MHPDFVRFTIQTTPQGGACGVTAIGKEFQDNGNGDLTRRQVDGIAFQLTYTYQAPTMRVDELRAGSRWKDDGEWLMAIKQNERTYAYAWLTATGYKPVNNVEAILVQASATTRNISHVDVHFDFSNSSQCQSNPF